MISALLFASSVTNALSKTQTHFSCSTLFFTAISLYLLSDEVAAKASTKEVIMTGTLQFRERGRTQTCPSGGSKMHVNRSDYQHFLLLRGANDPFLKHSSKIITYLSARAPHTQRQNRGGRELQEAASLLLQITE